MRLLFAFTMTQCFGFVSHENSNSEVGLKEFYVFRSSENLLNCANTCFSADQERNLSCIILNFDQRYRIDDGRMIQYDYYDHGSINTCPNFFQIGDLNLQKHVSDPLILKSQRHFCSLKESNIYGRRLLNYLENTINENPINNDLFHKNNAESLAKIEDETKEIYHERWDEWGNWSMCSVTCGNGRQVRWRHCSAKDCTKGLKKAQIKPCQLKKCDKNILNWLGIKT